MRKTTKRVLIAGYYGMANFGDDLFCHVIEERGRDTWGNCDIRFLAPATNLTPGASALPGILWASRYASDGWLGAAIRAMASLWSLARADVIVLGGGSILQDVRGSLLLQSRLGRRKRWRAVGVSVGPFLDGDSRARVAALLRRFEFVSVRDRASQAELEAMGLSCPVTYSGDLAALSSAIRARVQTRDSETPILGFAPCRNSAVDFEEQWSVLRACVTELASVGHAPVVEIIALNNHPRFGDDELCAEASRRLGAMGTTWQSADYVSLGIERVVERIACMDALVTTRLHGAETAYLSGVPYVLVEYHAKCTEFVVDTGQAPALRYEPGKTDPRDVARSVVTTIADSSVGPTYLPELYRERASHALGPKL